MSFRGVRIRKTQDQTVSTGTTVPMVLDSVDEDTDSMYRAAGGGLPDRVVIPTGVSLICVYASAVWKGDDVNDAPVILGSLRQVVVKKNGQFFPFDPVDNRGAVVGTTTDQFVSSPPLAVQACDWFHPEVFQANGTSIKLLKSTGTYFVVHILE